VCCRCLAKWQQLEQAWFARDSTQSTADWGSNFGAKISASMAKNFARQKIYLQHASRFFPGQLFA